MSTITDRKSAVSDTQSLCRGVAVRGLRAGSQGSVAGEGAWDWAAWGNTGGGAIGGIQVGVADRGVSGGGWSFFLIPPADFFFFSGEETLLDRDLLFSGDEELRDLDAESLCE